MSWQGWGGLGFLFGLGFATALLFGFDQADRLTYFKETLSFLLYLFGAGVAASGFTYGAIQIADKKFSSTAPTEEDKA